MGSSRPLRRPVNSPTTFVLSSCSKLCVATSLRHHATWQSGYSLLLFFLLQPYRFLTFMVCVAPACGFAAGRYSLLHHPNPVVNRLGQPFFRFHRVFGHQERRFRSGCNSVSFWKLDAYLHIGTACSAFVSKLLLHGSRGLLWLSVSRQGRRLLTAALCCAQATACNVSFATS